MNVYSSFICNIQNLETSQMFYMEWMDKQTVAYPYNGIVLSKGMNFWYIQNLDGSQGHYAKWKMST